jgi:uncharacterized repeat protein (TIGR01451 family)
MRQWRWGWPTGERGQRRNAASGRSAWRAVMATVLAVAMVGPMLAVGERPAAAAHQYLWWNEDGGSFRTFGSNASITIYQGAIEFECDRFQAVADVYVVPSGSASPGASLTDVSGAPNVVFGASGGLFISETIGYAEPGGTIPSGRYAVVYDECQNGKVDPIDFVLDPAFEVDARADVPPLPSLAALKASAGEQAKLAETAAKRLAALFVAYNAYTLASDFMTGGSRAVLLMNMYMTWGCGVMFPSENPVEWYCPTVAPWDVMRLQADVVKLQVDQGRHWLGIANDPPDPDFREPAPLGAVRTTPARTDDATEQALAGLGQRWAVDAAAAGALLGSLEKYQGADAAGDGDGALLHARNIKANALLLADNFDQANPAIENLVAAVDASGRDPEGLLALLEPERARVLSEGLDPEQRQLLANMGLDEDDVAAFVEQMRALEPTGFRDLGGFPVFLDEVKAANVQSAAHLRDLAGRMDPVIAWLESQIRPVTPVASAGGPYTGTEGAPVALDAGASTDPRGAALTFAWDVDGDGEFDDATGATPAVTFAEAAHRLVGVKATNDVGRWGVAYAPVSVAQANQPPAITTTSPAAETQRDLVIGGTQAFSVATSDPDGDAVSFSWLLNGTQIGTGAALSLGATTDRAGLNTLQVRASDGQPLGGTATRQWVVFVHHPDADSDGWRANLDCDDTDPEVHPGHVEVVGNGLDDDCDPATGDEGSPPQAAFTVAPSPAVAGEAVAFTDGSSDADGAVVSWAWDFGDGATSTERHPTHSYAAAGTYTVTLTVTDEQGDTATASQEVRAHAPPVASFSVDPDPPLAGQEARFSDTSTDADGTIASRAWDLGDGTTSTEANPTHTYAAAGAYTVTLAVTDDTGLTREVSREVVARGRPTADFATGGGMNVTRWHDGAVVTHASSVRSTSTSYRPENAIDDNAGSAWLTPNGQNTDQRLGVSLVPGGAHVVDRVVLRGAGSSTGVRDFEVRVSAGGTEAGDFTTVVAGTVPNDTNVHSFDFPPVEAAHVELLVETNWGATYLSVPLFQVWERPREGGVVSLREGPPAAVVAASSGTNPANAIDASSSSSWSSASGARTDQWLTVALGGERLYTIDRVGLSAPTGTGPRNFEIRVSDTTAHDDAFTTVFTGTASNTTAAQEFSFAATQARFVQLLVRDNQGSTCCVRVSNFTVLTPEGANAARGEGVGGFAVGASSGVGSYPPDNVIDLSPATFWQSASGATTDQHLDVLLVPGGPHRIDRVRLIGPNATSSVRRFEVAVSTTTTDSAAFTTVGSATLPRDGLEHWFKLDEPVEATFVRLRMLDNHGGTVMQLNDFRVYATSQGGPTLAFDDRSFDPEDEIVSWRWDFGDGATSTVRHPVHVYAAGGTYTVALTVTDADGLSATTERVYTVLESPAPDFTWSPVEPLEGQWAVLSDASVDPDGSIVGWRWSFPHTSDRTTRTTSMSFPDDGAWDVTLTVTDSQLLTDTVTKTVTVRNAPPTAGLGPDVTRRWGEPWLPPISASDPGATDRSSLQCVVDYGDGSSVAGACNSAGVRVGHAYADPGAYTATLTVTDKDGASASDTAVVTVRPHATFTNVYAVPGSAAGGQVDVVARLWDRFDFDEPVVGRPLTLTLGSESVTLPTDATGGVATRMALPPGGGSLTASFAGDRHLEPSSDTDAVEPRQTLPPGDIVFIVDESGSMGDDQEAVRRNIATIADRLGASVDFQMGVVGFGAGRAHQDEPVGLGHIHLPVTDDVPAIVSAVNELTIDGGFEPGYQAITVAMGDAMGYRPNAGVCAVLIADESANQGSTTQAQALAALQGRGAVLFGIVDPRAGVGYVDLAEESGGQAFDIVAFRNDPEPVLAALTDTCVAEIVQRPDLVVAVDNGVDTVRPGQRLTYAVTVTNASERPATGVSLSVPLPGQVAFVGAGDGGAVSGDMVTWPAFDLAAGASVTRSLTVTVGRPLPEGTETIALSATAADDGSGGPDITPANNTATDTDGVDPVVDPVAEDQSVTTDEDAPVDVVLTADDPMGEPLTYTVLDVPEHGTISGTGAQLRYHPASDYAGPDRFIFSVTAGDRTSNVATVSITVVPVNDPPVVHLEPGGPIDEGSEAVELRAVASDVEGDDLSYAWSADSGVVAGAGPAVDFSHDDGPAAAVVQVVVSDGAAETVATTTVEVRNVTPTVDAGPDVSGYWGQPLGLEGAITDPSGADTAAGLSPVWDFGDGTAPWPGNPTEHAYADPGAYTATLGATDKDGGVGLDTTSVTVSKRPSTVSYAGSTTAAFGWVELSAWTGDPVDSGTARLAGREVRFETGGQVFVATTGADGMATVADPVLLAPGTHQVNVRVVESSHYLEAVEPVAVVVTNSPGKVTGGALRFPAGGNAGFVAQSDGGAVRGELQYSGGPGGLRFHASELTALGISPAGTAAWFAGVGRNGTPFVAYVEDRGEPGTDDRLRLRIDGVERTGAGELSGGNIVVHPGPPS